MLRLFFLAHWRLLWMAARNLWPPRGGFGGRSWRHVAAMLGFLPLFYLLLLYQWIGLLIDEILFRGYRRVDVREPIFVLGVPRSGTTFVHEVLADDERYTTFSTWESFFAASVTWRRFWSFIGRIDRAVGRPLGRLRGRLEARLTRRFEATHPVRLDAPEEDFFCLVPVLACFLLVVPFPDSPEPWQMAAFDEGMSEPMRSRLLWYYRSCVQRHLHFHGTRKIFLSKNASFAPMVGGLLEVFPDARVICCVRDPVATVSSQLSVLEDGMALFDNDCRSPRFRDRMVGRLAYYHRNLFRHGDRRPDTHWQWLTLDAVRADLVGRISRIYERFSLPIDGAFAERLMVRGEEASGWKSSHGHRLEDFGLDAGTIEHQFAEVFERFPFERTRPASPDDGDLRVVDGGQT